MSNSTTETALSQFLPDDGLPTRLDLMGAAIDGDADRLRSAIDGMFQRYSPQGVEGAQAFARLLYGDHCLPGGDFTFEDPEAVKALTSALSDWLAAHDPSYVRLVLKD